MIKELTDFVKNQDRATADRQFYLELNKKIDQWLKTAEAGEIQENLKQLIHHLAHHRGLQAAHNLILWLEVKEKLRKPSLAIYDHTIHLIGGGQKYGLTIAEGLQEKFDTTIIANKPVTLDQFQEWYDMDLSQCRLKVMPVGHFEDKGSLHLDPGSVTRRIANPFHVISRESGHYDIFINNSMNEMVYPLGNISMMICHFPERRPFSYFYADQYDYVVYNSEYTASWIKKKWGFTPHKHIYPPVDMEPAGTAGPRENIILSVARFEEGGSKKQLEMVRTFHKLSRNFPQMMANWQLLLVGGTHEHNAYLDKLLHLIEHRGIKNIRTKTNISGENLRDLYSRSKIFWHICGLEQRDPALVEHFGMTIVEAMQNSLVPVVFDGGGQREIVEHDISGFRIKNSAELMHHSLSLIKDEKLLKKMSVKARERSKAFTGQRFIATVRSFIDDIFDEYIDPGKK
jgi:glycosyltransferase involved in cell wall biosynthesis